jgi:hypothetical protein
MSTEKIRRSLYVAAMNKMAGELSELEAKEVLLVHSPVYITSKDHDHADHIEELKNNLLRQVELKESIRYARNTVLGEALPKQGSKTSKVDDKKNS